MNSNQSSRRRSKAQTHALLNEFDKSHGMTVTAFCKLHQISKASFYSARSRYRTADVSKQKSAGFIAIMRAAGNNPTGSLFTEVHGIKLYQPVPAEYLKALVV